jgi:hypothetical protein
MQALIACVVRHESGVTGTKCGFIAAALMLIGVGAWVAASVPRAAPSTQIGINPSQMMVNAQDLPSPHYNNY